MQNLSHNSVQGGGQDGGDDQDKSRQKNTLQRDIIMTEADFKKYHNEKVQLEAEIRALKKDEAHIKINLQEKQARLGKVDYELTQAETVLKGLKKKMNLL